MGKYFNCELFHLFSLVQRCVFLYLGLLLQCWVFGELCLGCCCVKVLFLYSLWGATFQVFHSCGKICGKK